MGLPIGPNVLKYTLPSGATVSQTVNLVGGYNVVYIRMFRNRATVLASNDPAALPPKASAVMTPAAVIPVTPNPIATQSSNVLPAAIEPKPPEGAFAGFKKLLWGFQDPQPEELAPAVAPIPMSTSVPTPAPITAPPTPTVSAPISSPNSAPSSSPASINIEGAKPYEPPNLLNSIQQLFN
jgi:hypothetical protein